MAQPKPQWKKFAQPLPGDAYCWGDTIAFVTRDNGYWHVSVSCPNRYPTWQEIHSAWYELVPGAGKDIVGAILLPRYSEYVNIHPNCFHVHQLEEKEVPSGVLV